MVNGEHRTGGNAVNSTGDNSGVRHTWANDLASMLHAIARGRSAQTILDTGATSGVIVELPLWSWRYARINVGKKEHSQHGRLLLPIPVQWDGGLVQILSPPATIEYSCFSLGWREHGTCAITSSSASRIEHESFDVPSMIAAPLLSKARIEVELLKYVTEGTQALWDLRQRLTPVVLDSIDMANTAIAEELRGPYGPKTIIDDITMDALVTQIIYGDEADDGRKPPALDRVIDRAIDPARLRRVDVVKYVRQSIYTDARGAVRKHIGDPLKVGCRARKIYDTHTFTSFDDFRATYFERYPEAQIGVRQMYAALTTRDCHFYPAASLDATDTTLAVTPLVERVVGLASFEDEAAARCDKSIIENKLIHARLTRHCTPEPEPRERAA